MVTNPRYGWCEYRQPELRRVARGLVFVLWTLSGAVPALAGFWVCPGNLLTNQLGPQEALAQQCMPLVPGGVSQAQRQPEAEAPLAVSLPTSGSELVQSSSEGRVPLTSVMSVSPASPVGQPAPDPAPVPKVRPAAQQRRDDDARQILLGELARTQAQIQALVLRASDPQNTAAVHRLRSDEEALQRELARLNR